MNMMGKLQLARWRAQRWLRAQVIHRLGLGKEYPPIGRLQTGELVFEITHVEFRDGRMFVHGTAGAAEHGYMGGLTRILGTDGTVCWLGGTDTNMGVKPAGSTWHYTYEARPAIPD
jgi:hypothetical protein